MQEKLGETLRLRTAYDEAARALDAAAAAYQAAGDLDALWRTLGQLGQTHASRLTTGTGIARLERALAAWPASHRPSSPGALHAALAHLYYIAGRNVDQLVAAERAVELSRAASDDRTYVRAEASRGMALYALGRFREGVRALEGVEQLAVDLNDRSSRARALHGLIDAYIFNGYFEEARAYVEPALALAQQHGRAVHIVGIRALSALAACYTGDWGRARGESAAAAEIDRAMYPSWASYYVALADGDTVAAAEVMRAFLVAIADRDRSLAHLRGSSPVLAECELAAGRAAEAYALLLPIREAIQSSSLEITAALPVLARAYLALGEMDAACEIAVQAVNRARAEENRLALVEALWTAGLVMVERQPAEATRAFTEALALARALPYPLMEARILAGVGSAMASRTQAEVSSSGWA
jgi:tetratricopeptide (TPR) repeat protein